jgi:hypothetical protein
MDALDVPEPPGPPVRHTRRFLAAFYALAVVWGIRGLYYWEPSLLDLLVPLAFIIALSWWTLVDARVQGNPIPLLSRPWFFIFAWLLVPGYVVMSRGWRGVGWIVIHAIGWFALTTAVWLVLNIAFGDQSWRAVRYR